MKKNKIIHGTWYHIYTSCQVYTLKPSECSSDGPRTDGSWMRGLPVGLGLLFVCMIEPSDGFRQKAHGLPFIIARCCEKNAKQCRYVVVGLWKVSPPNGPSLILLRRIYRAIFTALPVTTAAITSLVVSASPIPICQRAS